MLRGVGATPNMFFMLPHKKDIVPPPRILLVYVYGVCIYGMLRAGKLWVWRQWANFHQGLGV
jgi:hypothetical protein